VAIVLTTVGWREGLAQGRLDMSRAYSTGRRLGSLNDHRAEEGSHERPTLGDVARWSGWFAEGSVWIIVSLLLVWWFMPGCQAVAEHMPTNSSASGPRVEGLFAGEPDMRVRIKRGVTKIEVAGAESVIARATTPGTVRPEVFRSPVIITSGAAGITIKPANGPEKSFGIGTDLDIIASDGSLDGSVRPASATLVVSGTRYPGFVTIRPQWSSAPGSFDVVASMSVESYLPGVLTHELFKDWPRQTYEAQAIAARTYALHERTRARRESRTHDVENTEADQVFGGATPSVVANEAVYRTRGQVLTDHGRLIRAYYSSTCGGRPASAADTWPRRPDTDFNLAAPLQGKAREHACQRATFYRWSVERTVDDVSRRLRAWARTPEAASGGVSSNVGAIGRVRSVEVVESNDAKRPNRFQITDDRDNEYTLSAEEFRMGVNYPVQALAPITKENRVHSGDVDVEVYGTMVKFTGRGWGHAVGMCQWCAKGFADLGQDYATMLRTFYPGTEVTKAY
jgi:stage II sporulation protein D